MHKIIDTIEGKSSSSFSEDVADETISNVQFAIEDGELPFELKFFSGDEEDKNLLIETAKELVRVLNNINEVF